MLKKIIISFIVGSLIALLLGWFLARKNKSLNQKLPSLSQKSEEVQENDYLWTIWEDPAGFSFEYPLAAVIDNHPEDEESYAFLTLAHPDHQGKITIICNDSEDEDIGSWQENNEKVKEASSLETKIASVSGRKIALGRGKEMTAFIDTDGVLYTIELEAEQLDYWPGIYEYLVDSFKLIPLAGETKDEFQDWLGGFDTAGADVVEPVEVIE